LLSALESAVPPARTWKIYSQEIALLLLHRWNRL
jgi:hypothetical protein